MKKAILFAAVIFILFSARGYAAEKLGKECNKDADCGQGAICLDTAQFGEVCSGKFCTKACAQSKDCPAIPVPADYKEEFGGAKPSCEKTNRGKACQWGWLIFDHCD